MLENAEKFGVDIVNADILNDADKIKNSDFRKLSCDYKTVTTFEFLGDKLKTQTYDIVPFLYFVKKEYLKKLGLVFSEGYFYEDQLWTMQLLSGPGTIVKIRFPFYYYRMTRPGSTTNHIYLKKGTDAAFICNSMAEYICGFEKGNVKEDLKAILLLSVFQFFNVWLRLNRKDRKIAWKTLNKNTIELAIQYSGSYKFLRDEVVKYYKYKGAEALKYDMKSFLRKVVKRR